MILWMGYAVLVGILVAGAAWATERLAAAAAWPTRTPWLVGLTLAALIPLFGAEARMLEHADLSVAAAGSVPAEADVSSGSLWDAGAAALWLTSTSAALLLVLGVLLTVWRARRAWAPDRVGETEVLVSEAFGPALIGLARPAIVLPGWVLTLTARDAAIIVKHEDEHRRARDNVALLFGGIVAALFAWNPAAWWMLSRLRAAVEVDCDARLLGAGISVQEYGRTLLEASRRSSGAWGFAPAMAEPKSLLERRLEMMGKDRNRLGRTAAVGLAGGMAALLVIACETPAPTDIQNAVEGAMSLRSNGAQEATRRSGLSQAEVASSRDTLFPDLRGILTARDEPLVYVDGELIVLERDESTRTGLASLRPDDIERIEVIKGKAAGATFGPRGERYGVIQIFTKGRERP